MPKLLQQGYVGQSDRGRRKHGITLLKNKGRGINSWKTTLVLQNKFYESWWALRINRQKGRTNANHEKEIRRILISLWEF